MSENRGFSFERILGLFLLAIVLVAASGIVAHAGIQNEIANRELGQVDVNHNMLNFGGPVGLNAPQDVVVDRSVTPNRVYVLDTGNNRVLGYTDENSLMNGSPADLVIGQPDFFSATVTFSFASNTFTNNATLLSPVAAAVDSSGNLYVADQNDNRVLEYDSPFARCSGVFPCVNAGAQRVFGQGGSFGTTGCNFGKFDGGVSGDSLCLPAGVAVDSAGNLYVADHNNRVLEYNTPTKNSPATDITADKVFGQHGSFSSTACTEPDGQPSADTLCLMNYVGHLTQYPTAYNMTLAIDDSDNLWVPDPGFDRVLEYDQPLAKAGEMPGTPGHPGDTTADFVIGLGAAGNNFGGAFCNQATSATDFCHPSGVAVDLAGDVYVRDEGTDYFGVFGYGRVLGFQNPLIPADVSCLGCGDAIADFVFGENGNFTRSSCTTPDSGTVDSSSLSCADSIGLASDTAGALFAADSGTNRVLRYDTPMTSQSADLVLGQTSFSQSRINLLDARGLADPIGIAIDSNASTPHLYVADSMNNRVLGWRDAAGFANGAPADLVVGQPDFESFACVRPDAKTLCQPRAVAVDTKGTLFVADTGNSRVLVYRLPFAACLSFPCVLSQFELPDLVFGQRDSFESSQCGESLSTTADSLCMPAGVTLDKYGNVYISDRGANRVLKYDNPFARGGGRPGRPGHAGDTTADLVIGQGSSGKDFTTSGCQGGLPDPSRGCGGEGLALDSHGNLYVANGGIWEYFRPGLPSGNRAKVPGHAGDVTADVFFGSQGFDLDGNCINGPDCLFGTGAVTVDGSGNVFAADGDGRVLEYFDPAARRGGTPGVPGAAGDTTADLVLGQGGSFSADTCNGIEQPFVPEGIATATNLCFPSGVALDPLGNRYVSDSGNHRVLVFDSVPSAGSLTVSPSAIDFGTVAENTTKRRTITLRNVTNKTGLPIAIVGETTSSPFAVKRECVGILRPREICNVTVTFTATDTMPHTGTLLINDNVAGGPIQVPLAGAGRGPR